MNKTFRQELEEVGQYWCFRAKYARTRTWYFRVMAWLCRRLEK